MVVCRRVNSNVIPLRFLKTGNQRETCCHGAPARLLRSSVDRQEIVAALSRSLVTENRLRVTIQGRDNKSLDASGTSGSLIDNLSVTRLSPAASTQTFDASCRKQTMKAAVAFFLIVLIIAPTGAGQNRKRLPHVCDGYSLFSWQTNDAWYFSLIDETAAPKTFAGISSLKVRLKGVEALKRKLRMLPRGEEIIWASERFPQASRPPEAVVNDLNRFCRRIRVKLIDVIT